MELGQLKYDFADFDIVELAKSVTKGFEPNAEQAKLGLKFNAGALSSCLVNADKGKVKEVIGNLIDNAIKYTTGSNTGFFDLKPNYGSDMMWLNGILQRQFDDYVLLSCNNDTIQDYEQKPIKDQPIYASQAYRFNIT
jgi:hypothetical protein